MALDTASYLVDKSVAQRAGLIGQRYMTTDGRYILDKRDLSSIRLTSEEYVTGLQGVEKITNNQAKRLINENNFSKGDKETEETTNEKKGGINYEFNQ